MQHAVWHGDDVTGATTFLLEEGLDTGPVLGVVTETIRPTDTSGDLLARLESLPGRLPGESWCHLDIRDDNLLVRPDGSAVILDWGMSRPGPPWVDEVLLDLHDVTVPVFDRRAARIPAYDVASDHGREDAVTDLVLALGMSLAVISHHPPPPGLPRLMSFRSAESHRLLVGARRRLGL